MRTHALLLALATGLGPAAQAATFTIHPITVAGSAAVNAMAINDRGDIVGVVQPAGGTQFGFEKSGATVTALQGLCGSGTCSTYPTSINRSGAITGYVYGAESGGFIWQNGAFVPGDFYNTGGPSNLSNGPLINDAGKVAFTDGVTLGQSVYAGWPAHPKLQSGIGINSTSAMVTGFNKAGILAGLTYIARDGTVSFAGHGHVFASLQPGDLPVVINDHNVLASSLYTQIWIFANNTFTYAVPGLPVTGLIVSAINNSGRVAGHFIDQGANVQRVFLYANGAFSWFGSYAVTDFLHVAMNDRGVIVVSDAPENALIGASYVVRCQGTGC